MKHTQQTDVEWWDQPLNIIADVLQWLFEAVHDIYEFARGAIKSSASVIA